MCVEISPVIWSCDLSLTLNNSTHFRVSCSCVCTEGTNTCTGLNLLLVLPFTFHYIFSIPEFILNIIFCPQQTEVCLFEVWDIPWQGTSSLLSQKCQPKGQSVSTHSSSHYAIVMLNMYWNSLQRNLNRKRPMRWQKRPQGNLWRYKYDVTIWMKSKRTILITRSFTIPVLSGWTWGRNRICVCSVCLIWQESVELLGQFKEFMTKYSKVYRSQEGEQTHQIFTSKTTVLPRSVC